MVKKLFALAGVSALTGLVMVAGAAGCTTTDASGARDGGIRDGARRGPGLGSAMMKTTSFRGRCLARGARRRSNVMPKPSRTRKRA